MILHGLKTRILTHECRNVFTQLNTTVGKWVSEVHLVV
jgi:hypothetical protein